METLTRTMERKAKIITIATVFTIGTTSNMSI